ncbi:MAG TPA: hypothetical protein VNU84_06170 [Candidatus Acidoferrum sp.]|nr:hypothetical protein [Candidatus Acidoferrum sp.]
MSAAKHTVITSEMTLTLFLTKLPSSHSGSLSPTGVADPSR